MNKLALTATRVLPSLAMGKLPTKLLGPALALAGLCVGGPPACGPEPVGVDDCRAIEQARCDAGVPCGIVEDADDCRRFYRDQCLHGLAAPESPGGQQVDACVEAIERAGRCAESDADRTIDDCLDGDTDIHVVDDDIETVCDLVREPQGIRECEFLAEEADSGAAGAGGDDSD